MRKSSILFTLLLSCSLPILSQVILQQLGTDINGEAPVDLSSIVSMNAAGDRLAIGAHFNDGNGNNSGHVRIYDWNGTAWIQLGADIDGEGAGDESGTSLYMSANGDRLAIGAPENDGNGSNSGHVRIYDWNGTAWLQLGADIDGEESFDFSGKSVSMNAAGDRLAIGAPENDGNGNGSGHVRIYDWNGTAWIQLGADIDGDGAGDQSGTSVFMNAAGDRLAIGAPKNDDNGADAGHVRIYDWNGTAWTQVGNQIDGEAAYDWSGFSVSMNAVGDRLAIGARRNDGNGTLAGHVRIYDWNGTAWLQLGADIDGEAASDNSGFSVSMNAGGDKLAIGAYLNDGNGSNSGHVRIYDWNGTAWIQLGADIDGEAANDWSGYSVSMNAAGDRLAIGAITNDGNGADAGHVRIFEECSNTAIDVQIACDTYAWIDGNTYTISNNTAQWTLTNAAGCDSLITLDLIVNYSNTSTDVQTECDSYTWIDGNTYTSNIITPTYTLTNAVGCDSIITLNLTITQGSTCDSLGVNNCNTVYVSDTLNTNVSDIQYQNISPQTYLAILDTFPQFSNPNCDSIVSTYRQFIYNPNYCTDTILTYDTIFNQIYDTTTAYDTLITYDTLTIYDTIFNQIYDTTIVFDTLNISIIDTSYISISVTDTLYIDIIVTGMASMDNTITVYPNPANDVVIIDNGNYSIMNNYNLMIFNSLSQQVFFSQINTQQFQIPVSTLGAEGTYIIRIFDSANNIVNTKYLILN